MIGATAASTSAVESGARSDARDGPTGDASATSIGVAIVDDHQLVALGLAALLADANGVDVVGTAHSGAEALALVRALRPDVVLMGYRLPDSTGAETARRVVDEGLSTNVVMITSAADRHVLAQALDAGCCGLLSKNGDRADLIAAVRAASTGDSYFTRDVLKHLVHLRRFDEVDHPELTDREVEVLQFSANGLLPDEIGTQLHLSAHTVKNHLRHAMTKLDAHTKLDAVVTALRSRLISIDEWPR